MAESGNERAGQLRRGAVSMSGGKERWWLVVALVVYAALVLRADGSHDNTCKSSDAYLPKYVIL